MKKFIPAIGLLLIVYSTSALAQSCFPEGITFETQEEIDNFPIDYPNCTEIEGFVQIGSDTSWSDITDLEGLNSITCIGRSLYFVFNANLLNMQGLYNLDSIGGYLSFYGNTGLINFQGFDNLVSIGGIYMFLNHITSFDGIESLIHIGGNISLIDNNFLKNIEGLQGLTDVDGYIALAQLDSLSSLSGLENLTSVGGNFGLEDMISITDLSGLDNLSYLGGVLYIGGCYNFSSFSGINSLDTLSGLQVDLTTLKDLNGLEGVNSIHGNILIQYCDSLKSLKGIENVDLSEINNLTIKGNPLLDSCEVSSICNYLASSGGEIEIHDNAPGCNSQEEVEEACETVHVNEIISEGDMSSSPNPFSNSITIEYTLKHTETVQLSVFNQLGQLVYLHSEEQTRGIQKLQWKADDQPEGLYYFRLQAGEQVATGNLVKIK